MKRENQPNAVSTLISELVFKNKRIAELNEENAALKQEIRTGRHMCAPIHLDGNGAQAFINAIDLSKAKQEISMLKKALEMACETMGEQGYCPVPETSHPYNETCEKCMAEYYIQRAKEEMGK